eukprot:scaffold105859_cov40-Prasinocladus_malaysianus.AAC.1
MSDSLQPVAWRGRALPIGSLHYKKRVRAVWGAWQRTGIRCTSGRHHRCVIRRTSNRISV